MEKFGLAVMLCLCLLNLNGQGNDDIVIGTIDSVQSEILNEQRKIWVHVPAEILEGVFLDKTYPVVYLLDGPYHFASVVGMLQNLSQSKICPEMIVVGIANTNRTRDLTPFKGTPHPQMPIDSNMIATSGGGEDFMKFIEKELIPHVNSKYPTQSYRMLIGHSFGGLTVMNTLLHKPQLFNSYVSIDPSMWWGDWKLIDEIRQTEIDEKYNDKKLYVGVANTIGADMDLESIRNDTNYETEMARSILAIEDALNENNNSDLAFKMKYYKDDDHGSVPLITTYDAIRHIFDFYRLSLSVKDYVDPESEVFDRIVDHYKTMSKELGMEIKPDEAYINGLGYNFMSMGQFEKAKQFFTLNVANYPESFNVHDSLGDLYVAMGEKEKAIKNYEKSLSLNKDSFSKAKLEKLRE